MTLVPTSTEEVAIDMLQRTGPCCLEDLSTYLPTLTWNEMFAAIDRMSRDGRVWLRRFGPTTYQISLSSYRASSAVHHLARRRRIHDSSISSREITPIP